MSMGAAMATARLGIGRAFKDRAAVVMLADAASEFGRLV